MPGAAVGGHAADLEFANGMVIKRTNAAEKAFYEGLYEEDVIDHQITYSLKAEYATLRDFVPRYFGNDAHGRLKMEDCRVGIANPQVMDVKIGKSTASQHELEHSGKGAWGAWFKKQKMKAADFFSKGEGYRVVGYTGGPSKTTNLRTDPKEIFRAFFFPASPGAQSKITFRAAAKVQALKDALSAFKWMMIASSVLFIYDPADITGATLRVKLIDFGHSYLGDEVGAEQRDKYSKLYLRGLRQLGTDLGAVYLHG